MGSTHLPFLPFLAHSFNNLQKQSGNLQISGMELLYKTCGKKSNESIVGSGNGGFYTTSYESVYVLGQCQGDLGASNCGNCVKSVVQRAQVECGSSALVKELEEMGFKQLDLNTEVLRMNDYDLEKSIDDLCGVLEWDPIQTVGNGERGFGDTVRVN
ncbi:putative Gnk2-like domain-containing protein [Helianthus annuus]|nr:putative Gnk2-like domain-containing protein [Helianthus annuus]